MIMDGWRELACILGKKGRKSSRTVGLEGNSGEKKRDACEKGAKPFLGL